MKTVLILVIWVMTVTATCAYEGPFPMADCASCSAWCAAGAPACACAGTTCSGTDDTPYFYRVMQGDKVTVDQEICLMMAEATMTVQAPLCVCERSRGEADYACLGNGMCAAIPIGNATCSLGCSTGYTCTQTPARSIARTTVTVHRCSRNSDCDDGNPCTRDFCDDSGICSSIPNARGVSCGDGQCDGLGSCERERGVCLGLQMECTPVRRWARDIATTRCCSGLKCHEDAAGEARCVPNTGAVQCHQAENPSLCCPGYTGTNCDRPDACLGVECANGGQCQQDTGKCVCAAGFRGTLCTLPDCGEHGWFNLLSHQCVCSRGWAGEQCDKCATDKKYMCVRASANRPYVLAELPDNLTGQLGQNAVAPATNGLDCECLKRAPQNARISSETAAVYDQVIANCLEMTNPPLVADQLTELSDLWASCLWVAQTNSSPTTYFTLFVVFISLTGLLIVALVVTCVLYTNAVVKPAPVQKPGFKEAPRLSVDPYQEQRLLTTGSSFISRLFSHFKWE